jgi:hypothetical protein
VDSARGQDDGGKNCTKNSNRETFLKTSTWIGDKGIISDGLRL